MIIECPDCGTKYTVKDEAIKPRGRTVRCTSCGTTWHCVGSEAVVRKTEEKFETEFSAKPGVLPESSVERPEAHADPETDPVPETAPEEASAMAGEDEVTPIAAERVMPFVAATPHARPGPAPDPGKRARAVSNLILAASIALIVAAIGLLHGRIERAFPASARLYQVVGLDPKPAGQGLELKDVHAYFDPAIPAKSLSIEATVVNTTKNPLEIPVLHAFLQQSGTPSKQWTFNSGTPALPPMGSASIKATFDGTGIEDGKILLTFSNENAL